MVAALLGISFGYFATLILRPTLIPPSLRFGSLREPTTILFLGVDVVYNEHKRGKRGIPFTFNGRSDTIMIARLDPYRNVFSILSIPRDTLVQIPHNGLQKVNAANATGGPYLAMETVSTFLRLPIDHYVVLNVQGLVDLVNELGGITIDVPKRMCYMDWTAKLKIDLKPGLHTLTGNQAMGFVRFRHDMLGDIGRVQRQQIFIKAVLDKAMKPESWTYLPRLLQIAQRHIQTDLNIGQLVAIATFVRGVPHENQYMAMMPGNFAGSGDWIVDRKDVRKMVARLAGATFVTPKRSTVRITIESAAPASELGYKLLRRLRTQGYRLVSLRTRSEERPNALKKTRIIAQQANTEDAEMVSADLDHYGDIVNASVGDIDSSITIEVGDDLKAILK